MCQDVCPDLSKPPHQVLSSRLPGGCCGRSWDWGCGFPLSVTPKPSTLGGLGGSSGLDSVSERGGERGSEGASLCVKGSHKGRSVEALPDAVASQLSLPMHCLLICAVRSGLGFGQGPGNW